MDSSTSDGDFVEKLRSTVTTVQRHLLDAIWVEYLETGKPLPRRSLERGHGGRRKVLDMLGPLGGSVAFCSGRAGEDPPAYNLTLLGALLTTDGRKIESAIADFLEYTREALAANPRIRTITSGEASQSGRFPADALRILRIALFLHPGLNWGGGLSANGWNITIPDEIDESLELPDKVAIVRKAVEVLYDRGRPVEASATLAGFVRPSSPNGDDVRRFVERDWSRPEELDDSLPLFRRSAFEEHLPQCVSESVSTGLELTLIMMDLDAFKAINDKYGHPIGDEVLHSVASLARKRTLGKGSCYRWGGDEFAFLLPNYSPGEALAFAETLRREIELSPHSSENLSSTATFGIASVPQHATESIGLLQRADAALLEAKRLGRNRVCVGSLGSASKDRAGPGDAEPPEARVMQEAGVLQLKAGLASFYLATEADEETCVLQNCHVLVSAGQLDGLTYLVGLLEQVIASGKPLLVYAEKLAPDVLATLIANKQKGTLEICAIVGPREHRAIAKFTGARVFNDEAGRSTWNASLADLGHAARVRSSHSSTTLEK